MKDKRISIKLKFDKGADTSVIGILKLQGFKNFDYLYHDTEFPKKGNYISHVSCDKLTDDWTKIIWKNSDISDLIGEEWKDVRGQPNFMVSNMGRVKSKDRFIPCDRSKTGKRFLNGRIVAQQLDDMKYNSGKGAILVNINKTVLSVKTLVGRAFINPDGHVFKNINGNVRDNRVENLELITTRK